MQVARTRAALPRRLPPDRQPLPPAPPPPHRRVLSPDQRRTLRHLAGGHRHPRHGLSGSPTLHQHARVPRQSGQPDFN